MQKELAKLLELKAAEVAKNYSNPDREYNYNKEIFEVKEIKPLSENTAAVYFLKQPSGKLAMAFFFYVVNGNGWWGYFFPTDSHVLGMGIVGRCLWEVEQHNYKLNGGS